MRRTLTLALCLAATPVWASEEAPAAADDLPTIMTDVVDFLGIDASRLQALFDGEILHTGMPQVERLPQEVAVAGVMLLVRQPAQRVIEAYLAEETFQSHADIVDYGRIPVGTAGEGAPSWVADIRFEDAEKAEAARLLTAHPGRELNLALAEAEALRALGPRASPGEISQVYGEILMRRAQAYRLQGLDGIEPYARRRGRTASPARELESALETTRLLERHAPDFRAALAAYPREVTPGLIHRHYWVKKRTSGRPLFVLTHQMVQIRPDFAIGAEREIFAGHTYNSVLTLVGVVPYRGDAVAFAGVRLFSEKITGAGTTLKRPYVRGVVGRKLAVHFGNLRRILEEGAED